MNSTLTNAVFERWRQAGPLERPRLEGELIHLLTEHFYAVCWQQLRTRRPDVVNEALVRVIGSLEKFRGEALFSTYVHRIILNECARAAKKQAVLAEREVSIDDLPAEPIAPDARGEVELKDVVLNLGIGEALFVEMKRQGVPDERIGQEFGLTPAGVRVKWHRLKKKLRTLLSTSGAVGAGKTSRRGRS